MSSNDYILPFSGKEIEEKLRKIDNLSTGDASIDVTASTGQTIIVKEVDANGKPTAWEAVDHQPRTHWTRTDIVELLPETTIAIDPESGEGVYPESIGLIVGKNYIVRWNGIEYNCVAQDMYIPIDEEGNVMNIGVAVGNVDMAMGGEGTGEPFIVMNAIPEFAAEFGANVAIMAFDGSESVVLSIVEQTEIIHKLDGKYLPDGLPYSEIGLVEIMSETIINFVDYNGMGIYPQAIRLIEGNRYTVTWNGTKHICTAMNASDFDNTIGETVLTNESDFFIVELKPEEVAMIGAPVIIIPAEGAESVILSISGESEVIHKIDNKYLPDDVGGMPAVSEKDNGAFLRVVDGKWAVTHLPNVEEGEF